MYSNNYLIQVHSNSETNSLYYMWKKHQNLIQIDTLKTQINTRDNLRERSGIHKQVVIRQTDIDIAYLVSSARRRTAPRQRAALSAESGIPRLTSERPIIDISITGTYSTLVLASRLRTYTNYPRATCTYAPRTQPRDRDATDATHTRVELKRRYRHEHFKTLHLVCQNNVKSRQHDQTRSSGLAAVSPSASTARRRKIPIYQNISFKYDLFKCSSSPRYSTKNSSRVEGIMYGGDIGMPE